MMTLNKEELTQKIGSNIKKHRVEREFTIEKLSLQSGIEYSQISRIERGIINTSIYHVYRISRTLEISMRDIFYNV